MSATFPTTPARPERPVLRLIAQGLGLTCVLLAVTGIVMSQMSYAVCQRSVVLLLLTVPLSLVPVVLGYFARSPLAWRAGGFALFLAAVMLWFGYGFPACGERIVTNEVSAVGSIRTLHTALQRYREAHPEKGYAPGFDELVRDQADYIDTVLATGQKAGYHFMYQPGPTGSDGRILSYALMARPIDYANDSWRSFFCDETGVVRQTREYRPATRSDPRID